MGTPENIPDGANGAKEKVDIASLAEIKSLDSLITRFFTDTVKGNVYTRKTPDGGEMKVTQGSDGAGNTTINVQKTDAQGKILHSIDYTYNVNAGTYGGTSAHLVQLMRFILNEKSILNQPNPTKTSQAATSELDALNMA